MLQRTASAAAATAIGVQSRTPTSVARRNRPAGNARIPAATLAATRVPGTKRLATITAAPRARIHADARASAAGVTIRVKGHRSASDGPQARARA